MRNASTAAVAIGVALVLVAAGAAWYLSRDDEPSDQADPRAACTASDAERAEAPPGLSARADARVPEAGNVTWRWDLAVAQACQDGAVATATVVLGDPAQGCGTPTMRASVTSGVSETEIPLEGESIRQGRATFDVRRTDLQQGNGSFVVSLSVTLPSSGFEPQDDQCLDSAVQQFRLAAEFDVPA